MATSRLLNKFDFDDICVSLKSSSVPITMKAYQLMSQESNYPLHIGVTEAGTVRMGTLKSAVGIGGLLALGMGDTMRVSLSADPVEEVYAARDILKAAGIRKDGAGAGRPAPPAGAPASTSISLANQVEQRLKTVDKPITVAVMGCVVNGPGEASAADCGIAGGVGEGLLFKKGQIVQRSTGSAGGRADALIETNWWTRLFRTHRTPLVDTLHPQGGTSCPK